MTAPSSPTRHLEAQLADVLKRLDDIERGRSTQLGNSSIDDSVLRIIGIDGTVLQTWGVQPDGSAATSNTDPKAPPRPNTPIVTSAIGGVQVEWNGKLIAVTPRNFSHVSIHVSPVEGFAYSEGNQVGSLYQPGVFAVETDAVRQYVRLVGWSTSGIPSEPSVEQSAVPGQVVADAVKAGIVSELSLADDAVTAAKIEAGAVTSTKVADNAITTPKLVAGSVLSSKLATGSVLAEKIAADAITADKIAALTITSEEMSANSITATKIAAGSVDASKLSATLVLGNRIIAGSPTGTRVELSSSGLLVIRADGDTTFSVDSSTGDVVSMGEYYTSRFGERIAMNSGGLSSPNIRAYPSRGANYASLGARTSGTPSGETVAYWGFRVPYLNANLVGFCEFVAENAGSKTEIPSSKMWYRVYDAGAGNIVPGWQAFHQDVALNFSAGGLFVRNNDNSQGRDLFARSLFAVERMSAENFEVTGNSIFSRDRDGAIAWDGTGALVVSNRSGSAGRGVYASNFAAWGSSWREGKTGHVSVAEYLGHSALDEVRGLDISAWRYRDDAAGSDGDDRMRLGLHLDELSPKLRVGGEQDDGSDAKSWDLIETTNVALAAIQEQADEIDDLRAEIDTLRARVETLAAAP